MAQLLRQWRGRWQSLFGVGLLAFLLGLLPGDLSAAPLLTLTPEHAACNDQVTFAGRDFPPGMDVSFGVRRIEPFTDQIIEFSTTPVAADGTLSLALPVAQMIPECRIAPPPAAEMRYVINVTPAGKNRGPAPLAQVPFTLIGTATPSPPNTGGGWGARQSVPAPGVGLALGLLIAGVGLWQRRYNAARRGVPR